MEREKEKRKHLKLTVCGITEDEGKIQEEFSRNFIMKSESPIEIPASLTLEPPEEGFEGKRSDTLRKEIPLFAIFGSASLVINITSDNIPHKPDFRAKAPLSCSNCESYREKFRDIGYDVYSPSKETMKKFEELECPGFTIRKFKRKIETAWHEMLMRLRMVLFDDDERMKSEY